MSRLCWQPIIERAAEIRLLTTREVAELLGVMPETVLRWIDTRGLPAIRLTSRALRYDEAELEAWLASRSTRADTADRELSHTRANRARREGAYDPLPFSASHTRPHEAATTEKET
jgi:excisionase family DNA binding protein